ncbi:hypothetical protein ACRRTK_000284 [Alexandromys fortis]
MSSLPPHTLQLIDSSPGSSDCCGLLQCSSFLVMLMFVGDVAFVALGEGTMLCQR